MHLDNIRVIHYSKNYLDQIERLWKEQFTPNSLMSRRILFEWLTEENPFIQEEGAYFLLFHNNNLVGMHGHMPVMYAIQGKKVNGYLAHDDLLSIKYRGQGLGKRMLDEVRKQAPSFAGALWFNEPNYRLYSKSGWLEVPDFHSFVKVIDPVTFIQRLVKNRTCAQLATFFATLALRFREIGIKPDLAQGTRIEAVDRFNIEFETFFDTISHFFGIIVVRSTQYLNWKYVEKPFSDYKRYAAFDRVGNLSGYMIIKTETIGNVTRGRILDILVHPEKPYILNSLIAEGIAEFSRSGAHFVDIVCTYPPLIRLIRRWGFLRARLPQRLMVCNWESLFHKEFIGSIRNWYLMGSDADGDAWANDLPSMFDGNER